jgi:hypothetical protein
MPSKSRRRVNPVPSPEVRRLNKIAKLLRKRRKYLDRADQIQSEVEKLGGHVGMKVQVQKRTSLPDAIEIVLEGKTMRVVEIMKAVQKAGYHSKSQHFRSHVNAALIQSRKFKRFGPGEYTAK